MLGPLSRGFSFSIKSGNLRGGLWEWCQQNVQQFSRRALLGSWSSLIGQWQAWGSVVTEVGPGIPYLALLLFWAQG